MHTPFWNLSIGFHKAVVNIQFDGSILSACKVVYIASVLLLAQVDSLPDLAESNHNLPAMVENAIRDRSAVDGKEEHVDHHVASREEWRGVSLVLSGIKYCSGLVDRPGHVVDLAEVVKRLIRVDRKIGCVERVRVEEGNDHEHADECPHEVICSGEEGH